MVREPAVAGKFYSGNPEALRSDVESYLSPFPEERVRAIGCMVPHAGYMYSGKVAGAVFSAIEVPQRCVVLCPNHTGRGHPMEVMAEGKWRTPLGEVSIDSEFAAKVLSSYPALTEGSAAHQSEHAVEVELPFLQVRRPDVQIVPIAVGTGRLLLLEELGHALAAVVESSGPALIIASSDMNHYEDDDSTRIKDHKAIKRILALDAKGLYETVMTESISMCGFGPAVAMLTAAKVLGATKGDLAEYTTSAEASGDKEMCVGYAGIVIR